jgi:hypothetical protein
MSLVSSKTRFARSLQDAPSTTISLPNITDRSGAERPESESIHSIFFALFSATRHPLEIAALISNQAKQGTCQKKICF